MYYPFQPSGQLLRGAASILLLSCCPHLVPAALFETSVTLAAGNAPRSVAAGDFNADSYSDLAVTCQGSREIGVWYGNAAGEYAPPVFIPLGQTEPRGIAVGDFNHDDRDDVAAVGMTGIAVLIAGVETNFAPPATYSGIGYPLVAGDLNNDSHPDLATASASLISAHLGVGDGTFLPAVQTSIASSNNSLPIGMALSDLDADGVLDVLLATRSDSTVRVLKGDGTGAFLASTVLTCEQKPLQVEVADLDSNGYSDVAVALGTTDSSGENDGSVAVFMRNETGFSPPVHYFPSRFWWALDSGDVNADGLPDLACAAFFGEVGVLLNDGNGGFREQMVGHVGDLSLDVLIRDLNRDALPDLAVPSLRSDSLHLFYNTLQRRGSALAAVQKTRISSPGDWFQELYYNYTTSELQVHPIQSGPASAPTPAIYGQWNGLYHYDYTAGAFTQSRYSTRHLLAGGGGS